MAGTSHEEYTQDGREQISMVQELRAAYQALAGEQLAALDSVGGEFDRLTNTINRGFAPLKMLGGKFQALKGALEPVAEVIKFVGDETARLADIADNIQRTGLGVEQYQRLAHVAKLGGTSIDTLSKSALKLTLNLREIEGGGGGKAARALDEIGLAASDLAGLDTTEQLAVLADALGGVANQSTRGALAIEILGKQGRELLPVLNQGSAAVREMGDSVGKIFTAEELAKAEAYQDSLDHMSKRADDLKGTLAVALAPAFTEMADAITDASEGGESLIPVLAKLTTNVVNGFKPVIAVVSFFAGQLEMVGRVAGTVGEYFQDAADGASQLGDELSDTWVGSAAGWISDTASSLSDMAGDGIDRLSESIEEHVPYAAELRDVWHDIAGEITGANEAASGLSLISKGQKTITDFIQSGADAQEEAAAAEEKRLHALERASAEAEHQVNLGEAQGKTNSELERLYQNQHAARLELLLATNDLAKLEDEMRAEEVRAAAAKPRGGGGRAGPTAADRLQSAGEIELEQARLRLAIDEEIAAANGDEINTIARRHDLKRQELELERQVLEATKARGLEAQENAARLEAIGREMLLVDYQEATAQREYQAELLRQASEEARQRADEEEEQARRRLELLEAESEARRKAADEQKRLHEEERARKEAAWKQAVTISGVVSGLGRSTLQLSSMIADQTIKDEDKRAKFKMKTEGIAAVATGIGEFVQAAAAYASLNIPQGIAHTAAGVLGVAQGGMLMAGNLPSGGASSAAPAAQAPVQERNTSAAATQVDSTAGNAADLGPRRIGGAGPNTNAGGVTLVIEGSVNGSIDEDFAEKMAVAIKRAGYSSEAAA